jgi:hypothetical protein
LISSTVEPFSPNLPSTSWYCVMVALLRLSNVRTAPPVKSMENFSWTTNSPISDSTIRPPDTANQMFFRPMKSMFGIR